MARRRYNRKHRAKPRKYETQAVKQETKVSEHFERYIQKSISTLKKQKLRDESLEKELSKEIKLLESAQQKINSIKYRRQKVESELLRTKYLRESVTKDLRQIVDYEKQSALTKFFKRKPIGSKSWFSKEITTLIQKECELRKTLESLMEDIGSLEHSVTDGRHSVSEMNKLVSSKVTKVNNAKVRLIALEKAIHFLREQESTVEAIKKSSESKEATYKAYKAAYFAKSRTLAKEVKGVLEEQLSTLENCPYCGEDIGVEPHADHIYPISKGGLSTESNMVLVCKDCNLAKSNYTLREFIERQRLNRQLVENNLRLLRKDF
ncbi:HNH endonuclease [Idiomarina seosinensis]|uniref:HNH endonuclease n=1 Tax=Idiomarina seosinensis TaxID=281739 RepID=UPI00384BD6FB